MNRLNGLAENIVAFSGRIIQAPVLDVLSRKERASHLTSHFHDDVHFRQFIQQFAVLRLLHIDAIDLFHQPDSILVDPGLCLCSGGIAFKHIICEVFPQRLSDLAAAGVMHTNKRNFGFSQRLHYPFSSVIFPLLN